jgi:hypothetical protein
LAHGCLLPPVGTQDKDFGSTVWALDLGNKAYQLAAQAPFGGCADVSR